MEAVLDGLRLIGKVTTTCQIASSVACPEKSKVTFEGSIDRMEATDVEAILEATKVAAERRELHKHLVVRRRRSAQKRNQDVVGSRQKLSATRKRLLPRAVPAVCKGRVRKRP
jgi:hypothetical protein